MNKILEGAKEAIKVAKCDHDLIVQPRPVSKSPPTLKRFYCTKCHATFYEPIPKFKR
jgi:RNase P subunit RPR2